MTAIILSALFINPTGRGRPRPGKSGFWNCRGIAFKMQGILTALVDPFRNWVGVIRKSFVLSVANAPSSP